MTDEELAGARLAALCITNTDPSSVDIGSWREGVAFQKPLGDDLEVTVYPMTFGKGRVCIGFRDGISYEDGWCYPTLVQAILAAGEWDGQGDPADGWHRNINTGRRRENGDPSKETVNW